MSLHSSMTDRFTIKLRVAESETQSVVASNVRGHVETMTPGAQRRTVLSSATGADFSATHTGRFPLTIGSQDTPITTGCRLVRDRDGAEFIVHTYRTHEKPRPGHILALLIEVEPE